jgi:hypothetical protein
MLTKLAQAVKFLIDMQNMTVLKLDLNVDYSD